jgi:hypothetical protein
LTREHQEWKKNEQHHWHKQEYLKWQKQQLIKAQKVAARIPLFQFESMPSYGNTNASESENLTIGAQNEAPDYAYGTNMDLEAENVRTPLLQLFFSSFDCAVGYVMHS